MPRKPLATDDDTDYDPDSVAPAASPEPAERRRPLPEQPVEDAEPAAPVSREQLQSASQNGGSRLRRGWGAANSQIDSNSDYASTFKPEENVTYVIRFLEGDPYVTFNRHWIKRPSQKGGTVNIPFTCLRSEGINKPCPLCDVLGDAPKSVTSFNIAQVEREGDVALKSFDCTAKTFKTIQNFSRDPLYTPISKRWWAVKKTKDSRGYNEIGIQPIMSDASLHDDYGYTVPSMEDLSALGVYEPDIVQIRSGSELMEIAKEMQAQESFDSDPYN